MRTSPAVGECDFVRGDCRPGCVVSDEIELDRLERSASRTPRVRTAPDCLHEVDAKSAETRSSDIGEYSGEVGDWASAA